MSEKIKITATPKSPPKKDLLGELLKTYEVSDKKHKRCQKPSRALDKRVDYQVYFVVIETTIMHGLDKVGLAERILSHCIEDVKFLSAEPCNDGVKVVYERTCKARELTDDSESALMDKYKSKFGPNLKELVIFKGSNSISYWW